MDKISIFGLSGVGKTCYLYAMSQIMKSGVRDGDDFIISVKSNTVNQQLELDNGFFELASSKWPENTGGDVTKDYEFRLEVQFDGRQYVAVPQLMLHDYRGGIWTSNNEHADRNRKALLEVFGDSLALMFFVDVPSLLDAMDENDVAPEHRTGRDMLRSLRARNQITFMEALFHEYRQSNANKSIPPVVVVISKADMFASKEEMRRGKEFVKNQLPSIFYNGSGVFAGITTVSLGQHLGVGASGCVTGTLCLNAKTGIHLPMVYSLLAHLSALYDSASPEERSLVDRVAPYLQRMMRGRVEMYNSGHAVYETSI